jgi:hypothetical protein
MIIIRKFKILITLVAFLLISNSCKNNDGNLFIQIADKIDSKSVIKFKCDPAIKKDHLSSLKWVHENKTSFTKENVKYLLGKSLASFTPHNKPNLLLYKFPLNRPLGELLLKYEPRHSYDYFGIYVNPVNGIIVETKYFWHTW